MIQTTLMGLFFGTIGTTIGGIIGIFTKRNSNRFLSFVLSFASGLMLSVVCFSLIPEALKILDIFGIVAGIVCGIIVMIICESFVKNNLRIDSTTNSKNIRLLKTGIIVSIGLAIHNIPEGIAIGSGFDESAKLGLSLAIAIALHDIPEGLSMAIPMKNGGMKPWKVMIYVLISGLATGIGALAGSILGGISESVIALCLAFSAGSMLYIVSGELIPEYNHLYRGRISVLGNMAGFILGLIAMLLV